jgi:hypothetical protein
MAVYYATEPYVLSFSVLTCGRNWGCDHEESGVTTLVDVDAGVAQKACFVGFNRISFVLRVEEPVLRGFVPDHVDLPFAGQPTRSETTIRQRGHHRSHFALSHGRRAAP